ncbi:MAG: ribonuclease domain-containing protein [Clostridia bacterium]|nr:ribonuclease domain-containing protein [Clostridia bacterium]
MKRTLLGFVVLAMLFSLAGCSMLPEPDWLVGLQGDSDYYYDDAIDEHGAYTTVDDVSLYLRTYGKLPENFITKDEARALGWSGGSLEPFAPGKCIGGDRFGNYEGLLPKAEGRLYFECDIGTLGADSRGAKRLVYSNDGLIYYTENHYESFVAVEEARP